MKIEICRPGDVRRRTVQPEVLETENPLDPSAAVSDRVENSTITPDAAGDSKPTEHGGPSGPEPTRYGDWERNGRCYDF